MAPTRVARLTEAPVRPVALMSPTSALAVTLPASPVRRTDPAPAVTRTAAERGTDRPGLALAVPGDELAPGDDEDDVHPAIPSNAVMSATDPARRMAGAAPRARSIRETRLLLEPAAQVPGQEALGRGVELQPVLRLGEAVALVREQHVLVVDPGILERRHDLLRLGLLDPRVVGALGDQQRDADVTGPGQRRARPQELLVR